MKSWLRFYCYTVGLPVILWSLRGSAIAADAGEPKPDAPTLEIARSSVLPGMPDIFYLGYKADPQTLSPDRKYALIYPGNRFPGATQGRNYLAFLQPLRILALTAEEYYPNSRHGGDVFFSWSKDSKTVIIGTLGRHAGTTAAELYELNDGRVVRYTDLLAETVRLAEPDFRRAGATPQSEYLPFSETSGEEFDAQPSARHWHVDDRGQVQIHCVFSNSPEEVVTPENWNVKVQATWNIREHRFTQHQVKRIEP